jgi:acetyltransferase-like isoleucine patch superfamily enzyme
LARGSSLEDEFRESLQLIDRFLRLRRWIKQQDTPVAAFLYRTIKSFRHFSVPVFRPLHLPLFMLHNGIILGWGHFVRVLWYTPLFQARLEKTAPNLYLYGKMPFITGQVKITIGKNCRIGGNSNISGHTDATVVPELIIGNNVGLEWGSSIAVGTRIVIKDNALIAPNSRFYGHPGHPIDARDRAAGKPPTPDQVDEIVIEEDVWLATGVTVMPGVTIGRGTIVGAGSVVTSSLPAGVVAAGNPCRVIRSLDAGTSKTSIAELPAARSA